MLLKQSSGNKWTHKKSDTFSTWSYLQIIVKVINWFSWMKSMKLNYFLTLANKNLFAWWHLEINSVILFSKVSGSAQIMETFSDKQRSQRFEPHWYGEAFLWISHDRLLSRPSSFKSYTFFDSSVSFMHSQCLKDFVCLLYRDLSSPSEVP